MLKKTIIQIIVFLLLPGLHACEKAPPRILSEPGVTRLTGEQARAHISGNTEKWQRGTGYYNPDGEMEVVWHKVKSTGTWQVSTDGTVCIQIRDWEQSCHFYVSKNGAVYLITESKDTPIFGSSNRGVNEIVKGKKLPSR